MNVREILVRNSLRVLVQALMSHEQVRTKVFTWIEKRLYEEAEETGWNEFPRQAQQDRLDCASGLLHGMNRIMGRGIVSRHVLKHMLEAFLGNVILNEDSAKRSEELGFDPPSFVTISPTGRCNLKCKGCYAADAALKGHKLDVATFDRMLREKRELWGSHFTVISGGEPLLWEDQGIDIPKLAMRHPRDVLMLYTNGTLIDDDMARRLADTGNLTVAISVEGFEAETNARRGEGVYKRIMQAFEHLRNHGVPFGISATATRDNWEVITSDRFADFYFFDQGALYAWLFQYMPIGRDQTTDLVVPPEARLEMVERMWRLVRERKVFMVDFWNSGTASMGCIAAGRGSGYFYVNWDGDIMPCVFTPYAADNIHRIYGSGGTLNDALDSPLFKQIRSWQQDYGYGRRPSDVDNWLCPCAMRDHFDMMSAVVKECGARPINDEAAEALDDEDYYEEMVAYGERIKQLTDPLWNDRYLRRELKGPPIHGESEHVRVDQAI